MPSQPLYGRDQNPAYALRFTWCGWSSKGPLPQLHDDAWATLVAAWETDGLRPLERELKNETILITFGINMTFPAASICRSRSSLGWQAPAVGNHSQ